MAAAAADAPTSLWSLPRAYNHMLDTAKRLPAPRHLGREDPGYARAFAELWPCLQRVRELIQGGPNAPDAEALPQQTYQLGSLVQELTRVAYEATRDPFLGQMVARFDQIRTLVASSSSDEAPEPEVGDERWNARMPSRLNALRQPFRDDDDAAAHHAEEEEETRGCDCTEPMQMEAATAAPSCLHFRCSVCLEARADFRAYDACGHWVCESCAGRLARKPRLCCPQCRAPSEKLVPLQTPEAILLRRGGSSAA